MNEPGQNEAHAPANDGGTRGKSCRDSGLTPQRDSHLLSLAIRRGWLTGERWATDATYSDLIRLREHRGLTVREAALLATFEMLSDDNKRVKKAGVKAGIAMEQENQADDLAARKTPNILS